jgi:diguanylate cyclase (GGDEF)-like protein/PAS domain S-box-containing protein
VRFADPGVGVRTEDDGELWSAVLDDLNHPRESIDATLRRLVRRTAGSLASSAAIFVLTPQGMLRPAAFWDIDPDRLAAVASVFARGDSRADTGPFARVLRGESVLVSASAHLADTGGSPYSGYAESSGLASFLLVPMRADGQTIGILGIGRYAGEDPLHESIIPDANRIAAAAARVVLVAQIVQRGRIAELALNAMRDAVIAVDVNGTVTSWNRGAAHMYAVPENEAIGRRLADLVNSDSMDDDAPPFDPNRPQQVAATGSAWMGRLRQRRRDGSQRIVESVVSPVADPRSGGGAVLVNRDISGMLEIGAALRQKELLAQTALDASPLILGVFDSDGTLLASSRAWQELVGRDSGPGEPIRSFAAALLCSPEDERRLLDGFTKVLAGSAHDHGDYEVRCGKNQRTLAITTSRVEGIGATLTIADVSDRARRERELAYSATHDAVTGLPNRGALYARAVPALNRAARHGTSVGLLFCDLDGFKELNDMYGHGAGDDVLAAFGARLEESCRISDSVARVGGDEFAVLLEDDVTEESLTAVAERIVAGTAEPLDIPAGRVRITVSVGAVAERGTPGRSYDEQDLDRLLERADMAMYHAKARGKGRWSRFDSSLRYRAQHRTTVSTNLVQAVRRGEITAFYQAQFGRSGELSGAEAVLRWIDPERGVMEPHELITSLGGIPAEASDAAWEAAAGDIAQWAAALPPGFRFSIPPARDQWLRRDFAARLLADLADRRIPPAVIRVRVDSSDIAADPDHAAATTRRLAEAGVEVALSGLELGSTGLLATRRMSIACLVLGGRFLREAASGGGDLLGGVAAMARQLRWRVIATGVETDEELAAVRAAGCYAAQGPVLAAPLPGARFAAQHLLQRGTRRSG